MDGSGAPGRIGDVAVNKGRIVDLAPSIDASADRGIDGRGLVLAPGFIDLHSHGDLYHLSEPAGDIKIRQGVCLEVVGNCGMSLTPTTSETIRPIMVEFRTGRDLDSSGWPSLGDYATAVDTAGPAVRVMSHVGHSTLRTRVMGHRAGPPEPDQMKKMEALLSRAMDDGAVGLSTGLYYPPSGFAEIQELTGLAKVVAERGGFHASHIRNEAEGLWDSLEEVIAVGRAAGVATHISHLKVAGRNNWSRAGEAAARLEAARKKDLDLTCDVYPYHHSATTILALIPPWAQEGGLAGLTARLDNPGRRERIIGNMADGLPGWENIFHNAGWDGIVISTVKNPAKARFQGLTIARLAEIEDRDPFQLVLDLIESEQGGVGIIAASMNEDNVAAFIALPFAMIGSDGQPSTGLPHPRLYGAFPRVIRRFVRELGVISLEEAIAKMTGRPAARLGLKDAGLIQKDYRADLVLFDPDTFADTATYDCPRSHPTGMEALIISGRMVIDGPQQTEARPGGFVRAIKKI